MHRPDQLVIDRYRNPAAIQGCLQRRFIIAHRRKKPGLFYIGIEHRSQGIAVLSI